VGLVPAGPRSSPWLLEQSLDALQRARDELKVALDRLPDIVIVHVRGRTLWANHAFLRALGYGALDEIVGMDILIFVAPSSRVQVIEMMGNAPDFETRPLVEYNLLSKSGDEVVVETSPTQAVVFDGIPARMVVGRDITERLRMQQKLILADRLASVGLLAAGVAHEVNNPLAYVLNNIEIARKELAALGERGVVGRRALSIALEGVDRIGLIVRELLMLSRGDPGAADPADVRHVVESTIALARPEVETVARLVLEIGPRRSRSRTPRASRRFSSTWSRMRSRPCAT